jgi:succinate dehydrogenase / fumarate reductase flavoprotein subunit
VDLVVFGRRAGDQMAEFAAGSEGARRETDGLELARTWLARWEPGPAEPGPTAHDIRRRMEALMTDSVGIYRTGPVLAEAVEELKELRHGWQGLRPSDSARTFNFERLDILELGNLLDLAYMTAASALGRTESRGAHSREDHPERDDASWLRHTLARLEGERVSLAYRPVDVTRWAPAPRTY